MEFETASSALRWEPPEFEETEWEHPDYEEVLCTSEVTMYVSRMED
ncbi:pyrroloquinoline quinone precursor peptide PqqA [Saccharopolyspora hirsuta]|uniref:Coenzyme PQQ synthesis protein A n=1 Tax=Saccharopolyspora hirsuta TaxID=1837 RepID=A0A5M7BML3_SACHI|nr:pyrroloquinoline quinone precursor peptide PqqA [Saccharopolyspora hirsuta]KAA5830543.1 pyrroloquinoline quinone precursor peptide PqqA [Saccharopolyspora hirsuta]